MALTANSFSKCTPSLGLDIGRCGTVTQCNALPLETGELVATFGTSPNYRIMEALFDYELEIKQCGVVQKGLGDILMANKVAKRLESKRTNDGLITIMPFIEAKQKSIINNEYWSFSGGVLDTTNWAIVATSPTGIPAAVGWFNVGERVYLNGLSDAGVQILAAYTVLTATVNGTTVELVLTPQNAGSFLAAASVANPVSGFLTRGTINVSDYEKFCAETPGINPNKLVPFWVETTRVAFCRSELYANFRRLLADNPLYQTFGDLPEIELNRQQADDYEKRWLQNVLWSKPLNTNQTMALYRDLPSITLPAGLIVTEGLDIGQCVGKRANVVGLYEQHAECSRTYDALGGQLNLPDLFESIRLMSRVRKGHGSKAWNSFDIYTDQQTARQFRIAMFAYYKAESQNMLEMHIDVGALSPKQAPMGFMYESYPLAYPIGVTINLITDEAFDDALTMANSVGKPNIGRWLWILDWSANYVATLASNRVVNDTGKLAALAAIDSTFACVMKVPTKQTTLHSRTYTVIAECPAGDLIISNFDGAVPEAVTHLNGSYG